MPAPNPIPAENAKPGDTSWRQGSSAPPGTVELYASLDSAKAGDTVSVKVSTRSPGTISATVYRLGYYGGAGARKVWSGSAFDTRTQAPCPRDSTTGRVECAWDDTFSFKVGDDWVSGFYLVKVSYSGYKRFTPFIVRDDRAAELLYGSALYTSQAYNRWGGESLYATSSGMPYNRSYEVSFDRPFEADDGRGKVFYLEQPFITWLEKEGYDVTYGTNSDFLRYGNFLEGIGAYVHAGQDEYWPTQQRTQVDAALASGKMSLAYFGGNGAYWRVRGEKDRAGNELRTIVCYKNTPWLDPQPGSTVRFRDDPNPHPESELFGVMYDGWQLISFPLVVADESHWLFEGTGLTTGTQLPGLLGFEVDRIWPDLAGTPTNQRVSLESPLLTAEGIPNVSHGVDRDLPGGTHIFASGTIQWPLAFGSDPELHDDRVLRMTANVLERSLEHRRAHRALAPVTSSGTPENEPIAVWASSVHAFAGQPGRGGYREGPADQALFNGPTGVAVGPDGRVYVADTNNNRIRVIGTDSEHTVSLVAGTGALGPVKVLNDVAGATAQFRKPTGVAVAPDGTVYVADSDNHCIRSIVETPQGWRVSLFAGSDSRQSGYANGAGPAARFNRPTALAVDSLGNVYVADQAGNSVRMIRVDPITHAVEVTTLAGNGQAGDADGADGSQARFNNPSAIAVGSAGEVFVFEGYSQKLKRIAPEAPHAVTTLAGKDGAQGFADGPGNQARFRAQMGLAVGPVGEIYIADTANFRLRKVITGADAASSRVYTIAGSGKLGLTLGSGSQADLSIPAGLAVVPSDESILVTDAFNNVIRRVIR
ncbi:hypothetical protein FGE12_01595 [Aggregicoccus sp. 17bor-14]|nr:hypothetical protein [Aggregicoccus sp. 17bor-14]